MTTRMVIPLTENVPSFKEQRNEYVDVPFKHELESLVRAWVNALEFTRHKNFVRKRRIMMV